MLNAIRRRRVFNVIHVEAAVKADIIVRKDTPYRREELSRRRQVAIDGQLVWVVSAEDLILSKLEWSKDSGSELQRRDVRRLLRDAAVLDHQYMNTWADQLGIRYLLDEARQA